MMRVAKYITAVGIQDTSTTALYDGATADFENFLEAAYENTEQWLNYGNHGKAQDVDSYSPVLDRIKTLVKCGSQQLS